MTRSLKTLCIALFSIAGLVASSVPAHADRDDKCEKQIRQAEEKLHKAVERHGEHSPQAHKRHEQLEEVRRRCGYHDHDHDRDRDRDHDHDQH
jgi:hypothetical protein